MGVLDGVHVPQGKGIFFVGVSPHWFEFRFLSVFLKQKCIRLVREKLTVFPYGQYIIQNRYLFLFLKMYFVTRSKFAFTRNLLNVVVISRRNHASLQP